MIVDAIKIPVTWRAVQVEEGVYRDIEKLLDATAYDVGYRTLSGNQLILIEPYPSYEKYGYVENRSSVTLWDGEWVVVSSVGEVRHLTDADYKKEFATV